MILTKKIVATFFNIKTAKRPKQYEWFTQRIVKSSDPTISRFPYYKFCSLLVVEKHEAAQIVVPVKYQRMAKL